MTDLREIESSLNQLQKDFNRQLEALGNDSKEFHKSLIELSSKYPDHKELLQFIVFINDKLETKHSIFSEIVVDSFNDLVRAKKHLVNKMIQQIEDEKEREASKIEVVKEPWYKFLKLANLAEIRTIIIAFAAIVVVLVVGGLIFFEFEKVESLADKAIEATTKDEKNNKKN